LLQKRILAKQIDTYQSGCDKLDEIVAGAFSSAIRQLRFKTTMGGISIPQGYFGGLDSVLSHQAFPLTLAIPQSYI